MTLAEAMAKAETRSAERHGAFLVIARSDFPDVAGTHYYVIKQQEKYAWTAGEQLLATFVKGARVQG